MTIRETLAFVSLATDGVLAVDRGDWRKAEAILGVLRRDPFYLYVRVERELPPGQAGTVRALLDGTPPPTYPEVAERLGLHPGSVHTHLRRVRLRHPELWQAIRTERRRQLANYHQVAVERARERSLRWGRRRYAARYRREHGRWPWEAYTERRQSGRSP